MRVVRGLAAILGGSLLGLTACSGGGDDPVVLPTGTTQPSATQTPTESTAIPSSTSEPTPTTTLVLPPTEVPEADAFVRQFFEAYNAAQDSGDFAAFDATYLAQCVVCIQMRDELEGWLADDGMVDGADWIILQQSSVPFSTDATATVIAYRARGQILRADDDSDEPIEQVGVQLFNADVRAASPLIIYDLGVGPA